jgi:hypothetical protein
MYRDCAYARRPRLGDHLLDTGAKFMSKAKLRAVKTKSTAKATKPEKTVDADKIRKYLRAGHRSIDTLKVVSRAAAERRRTPFNI